MPPIAQFYGSKTSELAHSVDVLACLCHQPSRPRAPFNRSFRPFARCRRPDCERGSEAAKLRPFGQSGVRLEVPILVNAQPGFLVGCKATHRLKAARINSLHAIRPQVDHDDFVSRHGESVWHLRCAVQPHLGARGTPASAPAPTRAVHPTAAPARCSMWLCMRVMAALAKACETMSADGTNQVADFCPVALTAWAALYWRGGLVCCSGRFNEPPHEFPRRSRRGASSQHE